MSHFTNFNDIDLDKFYFDESAADSAVRYIEENIRHVSGELSGQLLKLEDWQKDKIIRPIFGWKYKSSGYRKYTDAYIEIPKKNGKTFMAAAMAAIFLDIDPEGGSQIYSAASAREQAKLAFNATKGIIEKSIRLSQRCDTYRDSIIVGDKFYKPLSRDSKAQEGINPQLALIDELHIHANGDVVENLEKSMAARRQPLSFIITTAGSDLESFGYERHEQAIKVAEGQVENENQLVCIFCADAKDDIYSEETWKKANPNYGVSVYKKFFEKEVIKAKASPAAENSFKRYHLNIWTNVKDQWIADTTWMDSQWDFDTSYLVGKPCFAGLDLSSVSDITAFSLVFPIDDYYISLNWFFLPEDKGTLSADHNNRSYLGWVNDGLIIETPGNVVDYDIVMDKIRELATIYDIKCIAYDEWNSIHVAPKLIDEGLNMLAFRQGFKSMNAPSKELFRLVLGKRFNHLGNRVLRWMNSNTIVVSDPAQNIKLVKEYKKRKKKIDGMVSNVMALGLAIDGSLDSNTSYLSSTGGELYKL